MDSKTIYSAVQAHYSLCSQGKSDQYATTVAEAFGYSKDELQSIPTDANLGLSCGNPVALASLREGETVVDLGSGAGIDVFLSSKNIGPTGRAIGVDNNKDMLAKAESNKAKMGILNVEFVESPITKMVLQDAIADCVISNCVINLVPEAEKHIVFEEIFRILKPGGRAAISDILAKKPLPEVLRSDVAKYVGCIAGAALVEQYEKYLMDAGLSDIAIVDARSDLNVYTRPMDRETGKSDNQGCSCFGTQTQECCSADDTQGNVISDLENLDVNEWVGSFKIFAVKPGN